MITDEKRTQIITELAKTISCMSGGIATLLVSDSFLDSTGIEKPNLKYATTRDLVHELYIRINPSVNEAVVLDAIRK